MVKMMASDFAQEEGIPLEEAKDLIRASIPNDGPDLYCLTNEVNLMEQFISCVRMFSRWWQKNSVGLLYSSVIGARDIDSA